MSKTSAAEALSWGNSHSEERIGQAHQELQQEIENRSTVKAWLRIGTSLIYLKNHAIFSEAALHHHLILCLALAALIFPHVSLKPCYTARDRPWLSVQPSVLASSRGAARQQPPVAPTSTLFETCLSILFSAVSTSPYDWLSSWLQDRCHLALIRISVKRKP